MISSPATLVSDKKIGEGAQPQIPSISVITSIFESLHILTTRDERDETRYRTCDWFFKTLKKCGFGIGISHV